MDFGNITWTGANVMSKVKFASIGAVAIVCKLLEVCGRCWAFNDLNLPVKNHALNASSSLYLQEIPSCKRFDM